MSAPQVRCMSAALFAFLHHLAAFTVFAALFTELVLIRHEINPAIARSLSRVDAIYGISALVLVAVGLVRVYATEKGAAYYLHSGTFIAKIVLFIAIGLISIYPTRRFIAWRRELKTGLALVANDAVRARVRRAVHIELGLMALLILCAVLMARGIGYFG
jgi:putative membrane protein